MTSSSLPTSLPPEDGSHERPLPPSTATRIRTSVNDSTPLTPPTPLGLVTTTRAAAIAAEDEPPRRMGPVLLLLEGEDRDGLEALLKGGGFAVRKGALDYATLEAALAEPPGLILADLEPREPAPVHFLRRLEEALGAFAPPLVLLSSRDDEEALWKAFENGVRDVIAKPVPPALLRVKVGQYLRPASERERVGPYVVKRVLGRGGMGTVYEAERDGVEVALKVLDASAIGSHPESLARFRRETETLKTLAHPGIPRFFEAGRAGDAFYCAMELVKGQALSRMLNSGPLKEPAVRRILIEVGAALEAVHAARLVHRDVKPANILVSNESPRRVRLVDFGLAKEIDDRALTRHDEIMGTASYMSPEIARGRPADARSDAFALGMTALEAAHGQTPLQGSPAEILNRIAVGDIPRPTELLPTASPALLAVLEGLLATTASARLPLSEIPKILA